MHNTKILYNSDMLYTLNYNMALEYIENSRAKINKYIEHIVDYRNLKNKYKLFITYHNSDVDGRTGYIILNSTDELMKLILQQSFVKVTVHKVESKIVVSFLRDANPVHSNWIVEVKKDIVGESNQDLIKRWVSQNKTKLKLNYLK